MQEQIQPQPIPLKVYRTSHRLMVAAAMPGLQPADIAVDVTSEGRLILRGELRGVLKGIKDLLLDEWSVGNYHRELQLPVAVDGEHATVTYDNGVLVAAFPISEQNRPAHLTLQEVGRARGERVGSASTPIQPRTTEEHQAASAAHQEQHGGSDPHRG
jgi:HSP20 family protein